MSNLKMPSNRQMKEMMLRAIVEEVPDNDEEYDAENALALPDKATIESIIAPPS